MPSSPGILKRYWYRWKSLRLPWRKHFLVGSDLAGNTFWEFKDALNANRLRRIVRYNPRTHYADVKISPQWHQWLRHTRDDSPSIEEQQRDISRQEMMKELAAKADERWKSIPSYLDSPPKQQPAPAIGVKDSGGYVSQTEPDDRQGVRNAVEDPAKVSANVREDEDVDEGRFKGKRQREENPFRQPQTGIPDQNWKPQEWTPGVAPRR